ncbi:MAG: hypothetical protein PHI40_07850 [Caldisericia bacterium]|nr:hypothetical protein [Caldisericia bacterium]
MPIIRGVTSSIGDESTVLEIDKGDLDPRGLVKPYLQATGTGEAYQKCGTLLMKAAACSRHPGKHKPMLIPDSCGRQACPECWPTWAKRAGEHRITDTLNGFLTAHYGPAQKALPGFSRENILPRHISFHPSRNDVLPIMEEALQEADTPDEYQRIFWSKFMLLVEETVKDAGITSAFVIPHDIRLKSDAATTAADQKNDANRYRKVLDRPDWRERVKYYPHVHVIGFGYIEDFKQFYERTGWTYRIHGEVHNPAGLVYYLLSHSVSIPRKNAYVPLGGLASRRLQRVKEYRCRRPVQCDECLQEGVPEKEATRVIATLAELKCEHDDDRGARLRHRGRGDPVEWTFDVITEHRYVKTERVGIYRVRVPKGERRRSGLDELPLRPGEKKRPRLPGQAKLERRVWYVSPDRWDELIRLGVIPGSWFEDPPGGDERG